MTENEDKLIAQLFAEAARQEIADDGFTERLMACLPAEEPAVVVAARPVPADSSRMAAQVRRDYIRRRRLTHLWTAVCVVAGIVMVVMGHGWEQPATYLYVLMRTLPTFDIDAITHLILLSTGVTLGALWFCHRLDSMPIELKNKDYDRKIS